ncbi:MAG TPA: hypothetical protein VKV57_17405 [bacterium]|nr:hypothetical protein [bacterium]
MRGLRRCRAWSGAVILPIALVFAFAFSPPAHGEGIESWMIRGAADYRAGSFVEAAQAFGRAAAEAPMSARPALWMGAVEVARGDRAGATAWFTEALRRHPSTAEQGALRSGSTSWGSK